MYSQPYMDSSQHNYSNLQAFQKQNDNPMKDIKKNYGEYLRQQIKINEDKKKSEKYGGQQIQDQNLYQMNDISNQQYSNPLDRGNKQQKYNKNQESDNQKYIPDKMYGEFLKHQMEEKKKQNGMNLDFKQSKIQELQEKMAAKSENPYGKGGSGAPLVGKNGQVISSRKPDPSQIQYDVQENQKYDINSSLTNYKYVPSLPQTNITESLAAKLNELPLYKNRLSGLGDDLDKRDYYRANLEFNMNSLGKQNYQQENNSLKNNQSENNSNFRRNNKRLLDRENQNDADVIKKEKQKQDINSALQEQIQQKDRKKQFEKEREREEERRIEERVNKEREVIEKQIKDEEERKRKKVADIKQENEDLRKGKKNKVIPYHLEQQSPPKQQKSASLTDQKLDFHRQYTFDNTLSKNNADFSNTNNLGDFYSMFSNNQPPINNHYAQTTQSYALANTMSQKTGYINPYNMQNGYDTLSNTFYREMNLQNQRMALNSQESRNRNLIPEIDNIKQQIQDQYKNLQHDVQKAKQENYQAIDDRNKQPQINRQQYMNHYQDQMDYAHVPNGMVYSENPYALNQNIYRQQNNNSRSQSGYSNQRRQINSADQNQFNNFQMQKPVINDRQEDYNIQTLDAESKMIPMDLIDALKQKDKLTMSQLINYDQDYSQNNLINQQQNEQANHPNTINNKWDIPTMNSDITKDIDRILNHQQQQIVIQQRQDEQRNNYSSQSQQRNKLKSETAFNLAAKEVLQQASNNENINNNNRLPQSLKRIGSGYQQNFKDDNPNFSNTVQFQKGFNQQQYNDPYYAHQDYKQDLNMSELQQKLQKDNDLDRSQNNEYNLDKMNQFNTRDQIFEYKKEDYSSHDFNKILDEDSDEIKKQKAIKEIKEKFQLSTVNEEFNEKTKQLSTILETGKYQDNKELYESLRNVEDPDFYKLDELIRQFKSTNLGKDKNNN